MKSRSEESLPLPAKLLRPEPRKVFPRTRLFERIDEARQSPVLWFAAPGGAGKTVLASSYLQARCLNHIWYQVDERDADPAGFFHYLGLAAHQHAPELPPLPPLTPEYLPSLGVFSRRFFEALFQRLSPPAALVLDNYQEAGEAPVLHELIRHAADSLPPGINLMVTSRGEPPAGLSRHQLHGDLEVMGWEAFRLNLEEALGIARFRSDEEVRPEWVAHCHERAGGWTAGLVLMLDQKPVSGNPDGGNDAKGRDRLFDYFASEMLDKADPMSRNVLLETALLPRTTAAQAVRLTGVSEAAAVLDNLHRRNFFLLRRDEGETVYEYHPMFRAFLREWARRQTETGQWRATLTRAADMLAGEGLREEAADLYREAGRQEGLVRLIQEHAATLLAQGRQLTLQSWLDCLPRERLESDAWLLYWKGAAQFSSDPLAARSNLELAYSRFDALDEPNGLYLCWAAVMEAIATQWDTYTAIDRWISVYEKLREKHPTFPSPQIEMRILAAQVVRLYRTPDDPALEAFVARGHDLLATCCNPCEAMPLITFLQHYHLWVGGLKAAERVTELPRPHIGSATPLLRLCWLGQRCILAWHRGDSRESLRLVEDGLKLAEESGVHVWDFLLYAQGVYGGLVAGKLDVAQGYLDGLSRNLQRPNQLEHSHLLFTSALLQLQRGDTAGALAQAEQALMRAQEAGCVYPEMGVRALLALLLFQRDCDAEAEENLRATEQLAERMKSLSLAYLCGMTRARVAMERGASGDVEIHLRTAMRCASEAGGPMLAWWGPKVTAKLYSRALNAGIESDFLFNAIRSGGLTAPDGDCELWPWPIKVYTLGRFTILRDEEPIRFSGKAQRKPVELLMALVALGGREVPASELADALWPEAEGDAAYRALITNLQRLRQLLERPDAIVLSGNLVSVNRDLVWVDCWAFERLLNRSEKAQRDGEHELAQGLCEKALRLYHQSFLEPVAEPWATKRRERLRAKFRHRVLGHCQLLEEQGRETDAISCLLQALDADDRAEAFYTHLACLFRRLERDPDARAVQDRWNRLNP